MNFQQKLNGLRRAASLNFSAFSFAHASERLIHSEAIFSVISLSLTLNTTYEVGNANNVSNETLEYKLTKTPLYSGNT